MSPWFWRFLKALSSPQPPPPPEAACTVGRVHLGACSDQLLDHFSLAVPGRCMQRRLALVEELSWRSWRLDADLNTQKPSVISAKQHVMNVFSSLVLQRVWPYVPKIMRHLLWVCDIPSEYPSEPSGVRMSAFLWNLALFGCMRQPNKFCISTF